MDLGDRRRGLLSRFLSPEAAAVAAAEVEAAAQLTEPRSGRQRVPRALCLPPPASPSPSPRSQQQPAEQPQQQRHGRVERLHRQPYGGRDLSGRGHRRLQGLALRLGRRPREDLR